MSLFLRSNLVARLFLVTSGRYQLPQRYQEYSAGGAAKSVPFHSYGHADPGPQFMNNEIQALLKSLTRLDVGKIFRKRSVKETTLKFKFMTTEQIQEEVENALKRAEVKLQMPPVMKVREEEVRVLSTDPALKDFDESDYVFTDITYGIPDADRSIVIRSRDGTLSTAPLEVRKKLNQFYFPLHGRQVRKPKLFEADNLKKLLDEDAFEFVLDAMCIQFEPYEKEFHEVSSTVYDFIDEHKKFDHLRSTRHFGPMAFYLAWHNRIENLLLDLINNDYLDNCVDLIELTSRLQKRPGPAAELITKFRESNPQKNTIDTVTSHSLVDQEIEGCVGKTAGQLDADSIALEIVKEFVHNNVVKKVQIELAIESYAERMQAQKRLLGGLQTAHGVQQ